jgi:sugar lactone lactonase YvrE
MPTPAVESGFNEIVVDGRGNACVNSGGVVAVVPADAGQLDADRRRVPRQQAHCLRHRSLSAGRVWADLGDGFPDGICLDAEGALWYGDVPNKRCVRVCQGGEVLQTIDLDRGCFARMLARLGRKDPVMLAAQWRGMEHMTDEVRTGQVLIGEAPAPGVGWP